MAVDVAGLLRTELAHLVEPIGRALEEPRPAGVFVLFAQAGIVVDAEAAEDAVDALVELWEPLASFDFSGLDAVEAVAGPLGDVLDRLSALADSTEIDVVDRLVDYLLVDYLSRRASVLLELARLVDVVDTGPDRVERLELGELVEVVTGPVADVVERVRDQGPVVILLVLDRLLGALGLVTRFALSAPLETPGGLPTGSEVAASLDLFVIVDEQIVAGPQLLAVTGPPDGVLVLPGLDDELSGSSTHQSAAGEVTFRSSFPDGVGVLVGDTPLVVGEPASVAELSVGLALPFGDQPPLGEPVEGSSLSVTAAEVAVTVGWSDGRVGVGVRGRLAVEGLTAVVPALFSPLDELLTRLPREGVVIASWSTSEGFDVDVDLSGSPSRSSDGPIRVGFGFDDGRAAVSVRGGDSIALGPLTVEPGGLGISVGVRLAGGLSTVLDRWPEVDVEGVVPDSFGLRLEAGPVQGHGAMAHLDERTFVCSLGVKVLDVEVGAHGYLRSSTSTDPWVLFVGLSGRFPPVPLGFGFFLTGLGGLVAINRTVTSDSLMAALWSGAFDHLLFVDPRTEPKALVAAVDAMLPAEPGAVVVGPVAEISWGHAGLVTARVGVLLAFERGALASVVVVGQVRIARSGADRRPLLAITFEVFAEFAVGGSLSLLVVGRLRESRIGALELSGAMGLYVTDRGDGEFVLSAGGFHPGYQPRSSAIARFSGLERLGATYESPTLSLRLEGYFAITPTTVQFGGLARLRINAVAVRVEAQVSLDVLLRTEPEFSFRVDAQLDVNLFGFGRRLFGVRASLSISGPGPYRIRGRASVKLLFVKISARFDVRIGAPALVPSARVRLDELVSEALSRPVAWQERALVRATGPDAGGVAGFDPLAVVRIQQAVVPLEARLDRVGRFGIEGPDRLSGLVVDHDAVRTEPVAATFAPTEFFDLTELERLSGGFEEHLAGVEVHASEAGPSTTVTTDYEVRAPHSSGDGQGLRMPDNLGELAGSLPPRPGSVS